MNAYRSGGTTYDRDDSALADESGYNVWAVAVSTRPAATGRRSQWQRDRIDVLSGHRSRWTLRLLRTRVLGVEFVV